MYKEKYGTVILIPCYNEEQTVEAVITDFENVMPHADIFVYDNNSKDRTSEIVKEKMKSNDKIHLAYEYSQGKGCVARSMFRDIDAQCYIMVDGDDTYPAEFAPQLEEDILSGRADMAIGDRLSGKYFTENKRKFHEGGNKLVKGLVNGLFGGNVNDIMTGARAFSRKFVETYPAYYDGFELETDMTIFALHNDMKLTQHTIEYRDRPEGSESKLNTVKDGMKVMGTILSMYFQYKPLPAYSIIAALFLILGVILVESCVISAGLAAIAFAAGLYGAALVLGATARSRKEEVKAWKCSG